MRIVGKDQKRLTGVEMFSSNAQADIRELTVVLVLLRGIQRDEIEREDRVIVNQVSINPHTLNSR